MTKIKTASDYVDEIKILHAQYQQYPDSETIEKKLKNRVSSWADRLNIIIFQAQQEHKEDYLGWSEKDLGFTVRPMLLKKDTEIDQVGDYQAYYESPGCSGWVGLLVERKGGKYGAEDLYSTLMNSENCSRFYREIDRFREDKRFTQMVIIAECSFEQYLLYKPLFIGKARNNNHIGATVEARRGKVASLYARGIPVIFAGTRLNAIKIYQALVRQWIIKNYTSILKLDEKPYDDIEHLKIRKAQLEAELLFLNDALKVTA